MNISDIIDFQGHMSKVKVSTGLIIIFCPRGVGSDIAFRLFVYNNIGLIGNNEYTMEHN